MSDCRELPKCSEWGDTCRRPNPWTLFMMAHSKVRQDPRNAHIISKDATMKAKSRKYKTLKLHNDVMCITEDDTDVRSSENESLCKMYREMKGIRFDVPPAPPIVDAALDELVLPVGSAPTRAWADRAVVGPRHPEFYNKVYGYTDVAGVLTPLTSLSQYVGVDGVAMMDRIQNRRWLNDEILNSFLSLCMSRCGERRVVVYNSHVFSTTTAPVDMTKAADRAKQDRIATKAKRVCGIPVDVDVRFSLIPFNVSNVHWILMVYDHVLETWYSCDSCNVNRRDIAERYHTRLMTMSRRDPRQPFKYDILNMPGQRDEFQCGVWTCMFALCIVTGCKFPHTAYADSTAYGMACRTYIAKTMTTNSLTLVKAPGMDLEAVRW